MGKKRVAFRTWNPPTNNGREIVEDRPLPPIHYYHKIDRQAILQNTELPLEEKFCLLGGIEWYSVLDAQKYIYFHENVLKWDDSGAKEALFDAQERLFAIINNLPCEHPLPDPDIDNIDWNLEIDPGVVSDVEKENRYPDEAESSTENKISGCNDEKKSTVDNPLESPRLEDNVDVKDLAEIWNKCGGSLELKNAMNSLEQRGLVGDEASREKKPNQSSKVVDVDSGKLRPGDTSICGNNSQNLNWATNQNNDSEKIDSRMHSCACRKREEYQENTQRRKSRKQGVDSESQQVWGKGRPQTRYNLRPRNY